jgi:uncharacterized protein YciI
MLYVIICTDKPGQLAVRQTNRPDHIAFLEGLGGKLKAAGLFAHVEVRPWKWTMKNPEA